MQIKICIQYKGTEYVGWQRQKNGLSIQEILEKKLKKILKENISLVGSGRTDAGVHALSQVFDFQTEINRDNSSWIKGINSNLPKSIAVKNIFEVPNNFDSRFSAIKRSYAYVIYNSKNKPLFFENYCYWVSNKLDISKMENQLSMFLGKHDFSSFRSTNCNSKNPVKTIDNISLEKKGNFIILNVAANAFLQNMVRIMIGTIIDIAKAENNLSIKDILEKCDRNFAGRTAPAKGLFFLGPQYNDLKQNTMETDLLDRLKN